MTQQPPARQLSEFLVTAKRRTYASGGSDSQSAVNPLIPGSHQLEYGEGDFLYRDIYFGEDQFAGQEVVYLRGAPIWSMCYAGGWTGSLERPEEVGRLAGILQAALREVPAEIPYRGPVDYAESPYRYHNEVQGVLDRFQGSETIKRDGTVLYRLVYTGGILD
jgi:hypothetical protein